MIGTKTSNQSPERVGHFFLTLDASGMCESQGQVVGAPQQDFYLCQMFSWLTGCPTDRLLVPVADCAGWRFYPSEAQWQAAGFAEAARMREAMKAEMEGEDA